MQYRMRKPVLGGHEVVEHLIKAAKVEAGHKPALSQLLSQLVEQIGMHPMVKTSD